MQKAVVISAVALNPEQRKKLIAGLSNQYGEVELVEKVDQSVIAGVKVAIGSSLIDATAQGKLNQLKTAILE